MACSGPNIDFGVRRLLDAQQRFVRAGPPVHLRLRNFPNIVNIQWAQLGFSITPASGATGTTDILITPPPSVDMVSLHNIGMSGGKLRFGARNFTISATFVLAQMQAQALTDQDLVFRGANVVGLVVGNQLYSIEDIVHQEAGAHTVSFLLTCNANELK